MPERGEISHESVQAYGLPVPPPCIAFGWRQFGALTIQPQVATIATTKEGVISTVGVKELKNHLTQYLRKTKQGEEVIVTERGKPIALIQPIKSAQTILSLEARLAKLAAQGLITLPTHKPLRKVRLARITGAPISKIILEDRR